MNTVVPCMGFIMTTSALPPHDALPRMHLMATGDWSILLTATGCGRSQRRGLSVSRWRTDPLLAENGSVVLLRDAVYGAARSATRQPATASTPDDWRVTFAPVSACFERRKGALPSTLEIAPIATGDGEVRRVTLRNDGTEARTVDAISYVPLALGPMATDTDHPAYSKMFVQTAQADGGTTSLAWRRRSSPGDSEICAAHLCTPSDAAVEAIGFETDRMAFIGCGHEFGDADALAASKPPAGHAGTVLGPVFSLGRRVTLAPGASVALAFWTLAAATRDAVLARAAACRSPLPK